MDTIRRKIRSLNKLLFKNKLTKPRKMGEKILLLATAPCAKDFFEFESVREQFKEYDLAFINYMLVYSEYEFFKLKPRYVILLDPIFYDDIYNGGYNYEKEKVVRILEKVSWRCYLVTSVLADFGIVNDNIQYIRLSCFAKKYRKPLLALFQKNYINFGIYNVIQGALYFACTFGYDNVAVLGCTYKNLEMFMDTDGLHILEHNHYYDLNQEEIIITNEELDCRKTSFISDLDKRSYESSRILWDLKQYAQIMNTEIINYSEGSMVDSIKMGRLNKSN